MRASLPNLPRVIAFVLLALPAAAHAGVNAFTTTGPHSGWTLLAADPGVPDRVFAASRSGLYRSPDAGGHWSKVPVPWLPEGVAFDPLQATRVYAIEGNAVHRSDDGGATFTWQASFTFGHAFFYAADYADIGRVVASPHREGDLYFTDGSLIYSSDGGDTLNDIDQSLTSYVYDFALAPAARGTVYVANEASAVAKSTDNGATWTPWANGIPAGWAGIRIAFDASAPNRVYLVAARRPTAAMTHFTFDEYAVYASADAGAHWQATTLALKETLMWQQVQLVASADSVYVRTGTRVHRSRDFGATWTDVVLHNGDLAQSLAAGAGALYAAGFDQGVQRSRDGGATWEAARAGLPLPRITRVATIAGAPFTVLATTDFDGIRPAELYRRTTEDNGWLATLLPPSFDAASFSGGVGGGDFIDVHHGPYGFAALATLPGPRDAIALTREGEVLQSSDRGLTFAPAGGVGPTGRLDRLAVAPSDSATLYACGTGDLESGGHSWFNGALTRTTDGGHTWQSLVAQSGFSNFGCAALAVDPIDRDAAYLAIEPQIGSGVMRTVDGGLTWKFVPGLAAGSWRALIVDPTQPRRLFAASAYGGTVVAADVATGEQSPVGVPLPANVRALAIDAIPAPPVLYAGTDHGVFTRPVTAAPVPWTVLHGSEALTVNELALAHSGLVPTQVTVIAATDTGVQEYTSDAAGGLTAVYRLFNRDTLAHFFTASKTERDHVLATWPQFTDEGIAFFALAAPGPSTIPVRRFYNARTGVHAYAMSEAERAEIVAASPDSIDEGIAYHALAGAEPGTVAVYRFRNTSTGGEFLTVDDDERDFVELRLPQFLYRGVAHGAFQAGD